MAFLLTTKETGVWCNIVQKKEESMCSRKATSVDNKVAIFYELGFLYGF